MPGTGKPQSRPLLGVSVAFLLSYLSDHEADCNVAEPAPSMGLVAGSGAATSGAPRGTTRGVAVALKRRMASPPAAPPEAEVAEPDCDEPADEPAASGAPAPPAVALPSAPLAAFVVTLAGTKHFVTEGLLCGPAAVHVAHAWDSNFRDLVNSLVADSRGDLDKRYALDVFCADMHAPSDDPVGTVQGLVAAASEVLLLLDGEGKALSRLWVLFEVLLGFAAGKLRLRCSAAGGFGSSQEALKGWEAKIDGVDWVLAEATRKSDEKRLRGFVEREWEAFGRGIERRLVQLKMFLRKEIYGQVLVNAVEAGNLKAVEAALDLGANPGQMDSMGNTVEELAAFAGRDDIERVLFERRMKGQPHLDLSAFLNPKEFEGVDAANWFVTEGPSDYDEDEEALDDPLPD